MTDNARSFFASGPNFEIELKGPGAPESRPSLSAASKMIGVGVAADTRHVSEPKSARALIERREAYDEKRIAAYGFAPLERHQQLADAALKSGFDKRYFQTQSSMSVVWKSTDPADDGSESYNFDGQRSKIRYAVDSKGRGGFDFLSTEFGPALIVLHEQGHCEHRDPKFNPTPSGPLPYGMTAKQANTIAIIGKMGSGPVAEMIMESYADAFAAHVAVATAAPESVGRIKKVLGDLTAYREITAQLAPADPHVSSFAIQNALSTAEPGMSPAAARESAKKAGLSGALQSAVGIGLLPGSGVDFSFKDALVAQATPAAVLDIVSDWAARKALIQVKGEHLSASEKKAAEEMPPWDSTLLGDPKPYIVAAVKAMEANPSAINNGDAFRLGKAAAKASATSFVSATFGGDLGSLDWASAKADANRILDKTSEDVQLSVASALDAEASYPSVRPIQPSSESISQWKERRTSQYEPAAAPKQGSKL